MPLFHLPIDMLGVIQIEYKRTILIIGGITGPGILSSGMAGSSIGYY